MVNRLEELAELSVARGCGFAGLGIATFMVGLSEQMYLALETGGILVLGLSLILLIRGYTSRHVNYKRTELWIMLTPDDRPATPIAQQVIGNVLRRTYLRYGLHSATMALLMLIGSIGLRLANTA